MADDEHSAVPKDGDICRICHGPHTEEEPLVAPCVCGGSMKFVHNECLSEWLSASRHVRCEVCGSKLVAVQRTKPGAPPFWSIDALAQTFGPVFAKRVLGPVFLLAASAFWVSFLPWMSSWTVRHVLRLVGTSVFAETLSAHMERPGMTIDWWMGWPVLVMLVVCAIVFVMIGHDVILLADRRAARRRMRNHFRRQRPQRQVRAIVQAAENLLEQEEDSEEEEGEIFEEVEEEVPENFEGEEEEEEEEEIPENFEGEEEEEEEEEAPENIEEEEEEESEPEDEIEDEIFDMDQEDHSAELDDDDGMWLEDWIENIVVVIGPGNLFENLLRIVAATLLLGILTATILLLPSSIWRSFLCAFRDRSILPLLFSLEPLSLPPPDVTVGAIAADAGVKFAMENLTNASVPVVVLGPAMAPSDVIAVLGGGMLLVVSLLALRASLEMVDLVRWASGVALQVNWMPEVMDTLWFGLISMADMLYSETSMFGNSVVIGTKVVVGFLLRLVLLPLGVGVFCAWIAGAVDPREGFVAWARYPGMHLVIAWIIGTIACVFVTQGVLALRTATHDRVIGKYILRPSQNKDLFRELVKRPLWRTGWATVATCIVVLLFVFSTTVAVQAAFRDVDFNAVSPLTKNNISSSEPFRIVPFTLSFDVRGFPQAVSDRPLSDELGLMSTKTVAFDASMLSRSIFRDQYHYAPNFSPEPTMEHLLSQNITPRFEADATKSFTPIPGRMVRLSLRDNLPTSASLFDFVNLETISKCGALPHVLRNEANDTSVWADQVLFNSSYLLRRAYLEYMDNLFDSATKSSSTTSPSKNAAPSKQQFFEQLASKPSESTLTHFFVSSWRSFSNFISTIFKFVSPATSSSSSSPNPSTTTPTKNESALSGLLRRRKSHSVVSVIKSLAKKTRSISFSLSLPKLSSLYSFGVTLAESIASSALSAGLVDPIDRLPPRDGPCGFAETARAPNSLDPKGWYAGVFISSTKLQPTEQIPVVASLLDKYGKVDLHWVIDHDAETAEDVWMEAQTRVEKFLALEMHNPLPPPSSSSIQPAPIAGLDWTVVMQGLLVAPGSFVSEHVRISNSSAIPSTSLVRQAFEVVFFPVRFYTRMLLHVWNPMPFHVPYGTGSHSWRWLIGTLILLGVLGGGGGHVLFETLYSAVRPTLETTASIVGVDGFFLRDRFIIQIHYPNGRVKNFRLRGFPDSIARAARSALLLPRVLPAFGIPGRSQCKLIREGDSITAVVTISQLPVSSVGDEGDEDDRQRMQAEKESVDALPAFDMEEIIAFSGRDNDDSAAATDQEHPFNENKEADGQELAFESAAMICVMNALQANENADLGEDSHEYPPAGPLVDVLPTPEEPSTGFLQSAIVWIVSIWTATILFVTLAWAALWIGRTTAVVLGAESTGDEGAVAIGTAIVSSYLWMSRFFWAWSLGVLGACTREKVREWNVASSILSRLWVFAALRTYSMDLRSPAFLGTTRFLHALNLLILNGVGLPILVGFVIFLAFPVKEEHQQSIPNMFLSVFLLGHISSTVLILFLGFVLPRRDLLSNTIDTVVGGFDELQISTASSTISKVCLVILAAVLFALARTLLLPPSDEDPNSLRQFRLLICASIAFIYALLSWNYAGLVRMYNTKFGMKMFRSLTTTERAAAAREARRHQRHP